MYHIQIKPGGLVDPCYYKKDVSLERRELTTLLIPAGRKHKITQDIKPGGLLRYRFQTNDHDIGFYIQYIDNSTEEEICIKENRRYNSHLVPEDGEILVSKAGTCKYS